MNESAPMSKLPEDLFPEPERKGELSGKAMLEIMENIKLSMHCSFDVEEACLLDGLIRIAYMEAGSRKHAPHSPQPSDFIRIVQQAASWEIEPRSRRQLERILEKISAKGWAGCR
jgi:hypothetical protein